LIRAREVKELKVMKMSIINPASLAGPTGYNNGVLVEGGSLLFVAGQVGWDRERRIISDDFADQFALALENVLAVVREAGGDATNVAALRIYVTDKKEYTARLKDVGSAYRQLMGKHYPAMSLVEVGALVEDLAKVEIEAMAVIQGDAAGARQPAPEAPGGETK
jgi:enamine deaminase RidA (YjgF/YER057c/UK114 family)